MKITIVLVFVPTGVSRQDIETALRERTPSLEMAGIQAKTKLADFERRNADESPLWTWFVPNPCPTRGSRP